MGCTKELFLVLSSHSNSVLDSEPSWSHEHEWVLTGPFGFLYVMLMLSPPPSSAVVNVCVGMVVCLYDGLVACLGCTPNFVC